MDESALTAGLVGLVMASFKLVEKLISKANGGGAEYRLNMVEERLEKLEAKLHAFQTAFYEFREETRIRWAKGDRDE
jgi:hypothetical protein